MDEFSIYLSAMWPFTPLFLFTIAIVFRLLDNSAYLFLEKDILINTSNVSRELLKKQISLNSDPHFTRQLKRALIFRNLQQSFLIFTLLSLPVSLLYFF